MNKDKIKLIVEVDKEILFKGFEQPLTEEERRTLIRAIRNGKSYSDSKDAISRNDLKETIIDPLNVNDAGKNDWYEGYYTAKNEDVYYIDNAPALNLEEHSFIEGYKKGCEEGKRCYERPKSEWANNLRLMSDGNIIEPDGHIVGHLYQGLKYDKYNAEEVVKKAVQNGH